MNKHVKCKVRLKGQDFTICSDKQLNYLLWHIDNQVVALKRFNDNDDLTLNWLQLVDLSETVSPTIFVEKLYNLFTKVA